MAAVTWLTLLSPHLYDSATRSVTAYKEVEVFAKRIAELLHVGVVAALVMAPVVDLTETLTVLWTFCVLLAKGLKADVVYLTDETTVPATEITHVAIYKEIVGLHIVRPAI